MLLSLPVCLQIDENLSELKPKEIHVVDISLIFEKNKMYSTWAYVEPLHVDSNMSLVN